MNESAEAIGLLYNKTTRRILLGKKVRTGGNESCQSEQILR